MEKVKFQGYEFDSTHEATCAALFNKYGWKWEQLSNSLPGWLPDFRLRGNVDVYVECKGGLKWEDVKNFKLSQYEDAVSRLSAEVLLIPSAPQRVKNPRGYETSMLGFLFDGHMWSYAELGRWSGNVGFCHSGSSWKDRISGEDVRASSSGDGRPPDIERDWLVAESWVKRNKGISFFKGFISADVEAWETSSDK